MSNMASSNNLSVSVFSRINATPASVWNGLTNPEMVKQYFFGTELLSNWQPGSPIIFKGSWEGTTYEDKGIILEIIPEKKLVYNYWSSMSTLPDLPENYATIIYEITPESDGTLLKVSQDKIENEEKKKHSEENWNYILNELKKLLEK